MKRPAQPEEIAPAYVFFASPQCSSYITGEILPIGPSPKARFWRKADVRLLRMSSLLV
jgi:NAD(P)-dependent dehydrogenase (short-subunit alcohol dehydrogenase family)